MLHGYHYCKQVFINMCLVCHVHRGANNSTEPMNVNTTRHCKKTGAVYHSVDNDEIQFTKPVDITTTDSTATDSTATSNVQENPAPKMNETKTTT